MSKIRMSEIYNITTQPTSQPKKNFVTRKKVVGFWVLWRELLKTWICRNFWKFPSQVSAKSRGDFIQTHTGGAGPKILRKINRKIDRGIKKLFIWIIRGSNFLHYL